MKGLPNYNINNVLWQIDLDESSILLNKFPHLLAYSLKLFLWPGHQLSPQHVFLRLMKGRLGCTFGIAQPSIKKTQSNVPLSPITQSPRT